MTSPAPIYVVPPPPRMYDFAALLDLTCVGRDKLYQLIHSGELVSRKIDAKYYVLEDDLRAWQARLPVVAPTAMPASVTRLRRRRR